MNPILGPIAVVGVGVAAAAYLQDSSSAQGVLNKARTYASSKCNYLTSLSAGDECPGRVEKGQAEFFSLTLSQDQCDNGLVFICRSYDQSAFKLMLFDGKGDLRAAQKSTKYWGQQCTVVKLASYPFEHMRDTGSEVLSKLLTKVGLLPNDDPLPPAFYELDQLISVQSSKLAPGRYLLAVYGDNWMEPTPFKVKWVVGNFVDRQRVVDAIKQAEKKIENKRQYMKTEMTQRYLDSKATYERVLSQLEGEKKSMNILKKEWDEAHKKFQNLAESGERQVISRGRTSKTQYRRRFPSPPNPRQASPEPPPSYYSDDDSDY